MTDIINVANKRIKVKPYGNVYGAYQIPYAQSNGRFKEASPLILDDLPDYIDCSVRGPVFSQNANRLSKVMGHTDAEKNQSEDAFHLNIFSKEGFKNKPVLFWIHGGGWLTGGGSLPWYDGNHLVENQDVVVVTINYRLGALGAFYQEDQSTYNYAMQDIWQALKWVYKHIAEFGGNPNRITVGGQSAGAWYSVALLGLPEFSQYVNRVLLQSFAGNVAPLNIDEGKQSALDLKAQLSDDNLETVSIEKLLQAQGAVMKEFSQQTDAIIPAKFVPISDQLDTCDKLIQQAVEQSAGKVDVMAWVTESETTAFLDDLTDEQNIISTIETEFVNPTVQLLDLFKEKGSQVQYHTVKGGNAKFGATHCFDIPLLFNNYENWENAPMLQDIDWQKTKEESSFLQQQLGQWMS